MAKESQYLDLSPATIGALRARLNGSHRPGGRALSLKDFATEATHIIGRSLYDAWVGEGHCTPTAILKRMEQELHWRKTVTPAVIEEKPVAKKVVAGDDEGDDEDDIPF